MRLKIVFAVLLVACGVANATSYVGELRTPYVINVTVDPKAASVPEAKEYLAKATKLIGTNFQVAEFEEVLTINASGQYSIKSIIPTGSVVASVTPLDKVVRMGDGRIVKGRPVASKVVEMRGSSEPALMALINDKLQKIFFTRARTSSAPRLCHQAV